MLETPTVRSARLRAATWDAHQDAADGGFLGALCDGTGTRADLRRLVSQQLVLYRTLENAVARCGAGLVQVLHDPALERTSALVDDLTALGGPAEMLPSTKAYAAHLDAIAGDPVRLAAHHYTRYLGDLSGGVFIGRALAARFGEPGTSFYRFPIGNPVAFKQAYRERLDSARLTEHEEAALLAEIHDAYRRANTMHAELAEFLDVRAA